MANPWMKFYPQDWRSDERLRMCSLAARGLWIEMLCLMHRSEQYGLLLISGKAPTDAQLAVQAGCSADQIPDLLAELEQADVFSRTRKGVIYSRRMMRDEKKAQNARKNGAKGGNPNLYKTKEKTASDNPEDKGGDKAQKPEARTLTNVSGVPPTLAERLFGECLDYIKSTGQSDKAARSLIGKWRSLYKDAETVRRIAYCQANSISDPVAYIPKMSGGPSPQDERAAYLAKRYG
jgi:hypothetical protein